MTSKPVNPNGPFNRHQGAQARSERFMLTLCQLAAAVSIRPPRAPQLQPYTFFMSRTYQPDGSEGLFLHMGYFSTLLEAESWAEAVRGHYPSAFAHVAPAAVVPPAQPEAPSLSTGSFHRVAARGSDPATVHDDTLSDTAVMRILETRRASPGEEDVDQRSFDQIALLRPDDTGVREALKEAVVQGGPVSFAVQLHWTTQPIDPERVAPLPIFKSHTLYSTQTYRKGQVRNFLRLGFFADPMSAKQVAVQVLTRFPSAAVVPVVEAEVTRARDAALKGTAIPYLTERLVEGADDPFEMRHASTQTDTGDNPSRGAPAGAGTPAAPRRRKAEQEMRLEPDLLSESGVRHLKVEVQEQLSGRWKIVHLEGTQTDAEQSTN